MHLGRRFLEAKNQLTPFHSEYVILHEDPEYPERPASITVPSPNWMAAAMAGGIIPPIEAFLQDQQTLDAYIERHGSSIGFDWRNYSRCYGYCEPAEKMSEREAINYLIMKDLPARVWRDYRGNRSILRVVKRSELNDNCKYRSAWRIRNLS